MTVLHIPTEGGLIINGLAYLPTGAGPHPVLVLLHGLPGNEKNLDIAQAARRAGWVAVTFNYRGTWGSPGTFSFKGCVVDTHAVLAYLRDPKTASVLRLDPRRLVLAGHSMGGTVTVATAAHERGLAGIVLISAWDMNGARALPHDKLVAMMADDMETLAGVTPQSLARQVEAQGAQFSFADASKAFVGTPLLVLTSDDGLRAGSDALVQAVRAAGGRKVTALHGATDHSWSDHRIKLESDLLGWLQRLP